MKRSANRTHKDYTDKQNKTLFELAADENPAQRSEFWKTALAGSVQTDGLRTVAQKSRMEIGLRVAVGLMHRDPARVASIFRDNHERIWVARSLGQTPVDGGKRSPRKKNTKDIGFILARHLNDLI